MKKKILTKGVSALLIVSMVFCIYALAQVRSRGYVMVAGRSVFRVATGSMEPTIQTGALLMARRADINEIGEGDIICYISDDSSTMGMVITHRVTAVRADSEGNVLLETKGDANLAVDAGYVTERQLIGIVVWYSKEGNPVAMVISALTTRIGFLACIVFPVLLVTGLILHNCVRNIRRDMEQMVYDMEHPDVEETPVFTNEEYAAMVERVRRELMEELSKNAENAKKGETGA